MLAIDDLRREPQEVSDGTPDTMLVRLPTVVPGRAFTVLVDFSAGWTRPHSGYYENFEEIYVVSGEIEMSGVRYGAGDYGWFPAGYLREDSKTPDGARVLATFGGPARWHRSGEAAVELGTGEVTRSFVVDAATEPGPFGGAGRRLRSVPGSESWICEGVPRGTAPGERFVEIFGLDPMVWAAVAPGGEIPEIACPAFCRLTFVGA